MSEVIQLMDVKDLTDLTSVSENISPELIKPFLGNATVMYIIPVIGDSMYNDMVLDISTGGTRYTNFKEDYLFYALSWYAVYNALPFIHTKITKAGITKQHGDNSENAEIDELGLLIKRTEQIAVSYLNRMRDYLDANQSTFPLYRSANADEVARPTGHSIYVPKKYSNGYRYDPQNSNWI